MNPTIKIRKANFEDAETLAEIGLQSFNEAFAEHPKNHPDDMKIYTDEAFSVENLQKELNDADAVFFVAELEDEIVGYAKLQRNSREDCVSGENLLELNRLYALDKYIGKGIGKALMLKCLEFAETNQHDIFWLGVWEFNFRAQKFYEKFGFEKCGEHVFQLGSDPQVDWIMQKRI
jgi:diamine N-acetyltransferase